MKPTREIELDVHDLGHDGRGVARVDGKTVFVAGALPGERARVRVYRRHRQYDEAETVEVLHASADRVAPRCPHFGTCGGCTLQHLDPCAQIAAKQRVLAENFERIGKVTPEEWLAPLTGEPWGYRRRGRLSVRHVPKKGRTLVGFREAANPRYVADVRHCDVVDPRLGKRIDALGELVTSMQAAADIAQIEFAAGDDGVALVFRHLKPLAEADREALCAFARQFGFFVYLQPGGNDSVHPLWPEQPRLAFGLPDDGIRFDFEPLDFVQVNERINQRMVSQVLGLLAPGAGDRVLDLFCGLGNFTLPLARRAGEVAGVEGEAGLVRRAEANAAANGLNNVRFHVANLFDDQRDLAWARQDWDAILLDPPRAGAAEVFEYLPRRATRRVVYVSCHPASLARDAGMLVHRHGLRLAAAGVMDMFPHTAHVESVALFVRD